MVQTLPGVATRLGVALVAALVAACGLGDARSQSGADESSTGNAGITELTVFTIGADRADARSLTRVFVENLSDVELRHPWQVTLSDRESGATLARCGAARLPDSRVAVCELWLPAAAVTEEHVLVARLDRSLDGFANWDRDPADDERSTRVRTTLPGASPLEITAWEVSPREIFGQAEIHFRFDVAGAYLAWLLTADSDLLVAGHPADGVLAGRGSVVLQRSGPVTLVARNALGAFVYESVTVREVGGERPGELQPVRPQVTARDRLFEARILEAGVFDDDENAAVLGYLRRSLAAEPGASPPGQPR
jgi:hypothetical protein